MTSELPPFGLPAFVGLISSLKEAGYTFRKIGQLSTPLPRNSFFLRHDVDFHIALVRDMADSEAKLGIPATYFVPVCLPFNILYPENRRLLRELTLMGHEVGLHYDLEIYPEDLTEASRRLDWEIEILSNVIEAPIRSIALHNFHKWSFDPFQKGSKYVNAYDPSLTKDCVYISDSCRAWRDEMLLGCLGSNPPPRVILTIHPELWLDAGMIDRFLYLDKVLIKSSLAQYRHYFDSVVRRIWASHPAPKLDEARNLHQKRQSHNDTKRNRKDKS